MAAKTFAIADATTPVHSPGTLVWSNPPSWNTGDTVALSLTAAATATDATPPTVTSGSTGYFTSVDATTALTGPQKSGASVYTKVTFSEDMKHVKGSTATARPELFRRIGTADTQYHIVNNGDTLESGDCKPNHATETDEYICLYTVASGDNGAFAVKAGTNSVDKAGNALASVYTHTGTVTLDNTAPSVTANLSGYFKTAAATTALTGPVKAGVDIYVKVTFSENMRHVKSDGQSARPALGYSTAGGGGDFDLVDSGDSLAHEDCQPNHATNTNVYICRYTVQGSDSGQFGFEVDSGPDKHGLGRQRAGEHLPTRNEAADRHRRARRAERAGAGLRHGEPGQRRDALDRRHRRRDRRQGHALQRRPVHDRGERGDGRDGRNEPVRGHRRRHGADVRRPGHLLREACRRGGQRLRLLDGKRRLHLRRHRPRDRLPVRRDADGRDRIDDHAEGRDGEGREVRGSRGGRGVDERGRLRRPGRGRRQLLDQPGLARGLPEGGGAHGRRPPAKKVCVYAEDAVGQQPRGTVEHGHRGGANAAPSFTSDATFSVAENQATAVGTVAASDSDSGDSVTYAVTGGADAAEFEIGATSGELAFLIAPDFESPQDAESETPSNAATNNQYVLVVTATGGTGARALTAAQTIVVTVTDVDEPPSAPTGLSVSARGTTTLRATWTAPENAGKPAIGGYDVQYRRGSTGNWSTHTHSGTAVTAYIGGLMASTGYQVRVRAKNDDGEGDWATASGTTATAGTVNAIWSATLNVDKDGTLLGCVNGRSSMDACSSASVLTDDDFVWNGVTYTVTELYWEHQAPSPQCYGHRCHRRQDLARRADAERGQHAVRNFRCRRHRFRHGEPFCSGMPGAWAGRTMRRFRCR